MNKLNVDLENCYGIKKLQTQFDFSQQKAYAIYAPNGAMKSSLAQTFKDVADATASKDRIFPARVCSRKITDENGVDLPKESVLSFAPMTTKLSATRRKLRPCSWTVSCERNTRNFT